jgi:TRAP-type transport system small permease protein
MLKQIIDQYCKLISYLLALIMLAMVVLVFGNVFMRYALNSGFTISEELSRWLFVWMTFLGAVVALRDNGHLGWSFGRKGKKNLHGFVAGVDVVL